MITLSGGAGPLLRMTSQAQTVDRRAWFRHFEGQHFEAPMDDLNYLFFRQQQERVLAARITSDEARQAHRELARIYESRIRELTNGRIDIRPIDEGHST